MLILNYPTVYDRLRSPDSAEWDEIEQDMRYMAAALKAKRRQKQLKAKRERKKRLRSKLIECVSLTVSGLFHAVVIVALIIVICTIGSVMF